MQQLIVLAIAALVAVVILALFGKKIHILGLQISFSGMKVKVKVDSKEDESYNYPRLDDLQEPWERTNVSSLLPGQTDPPPNKLAGKEFMDEDYTGTLIASLQQNYQEGDDVDFDDGISQESEER